MNDGFLPRLKIPELHVILGMHFQRSSRMLSVLRSSAHICSSG